MIFEQSSVFVRDVPAGSGSAQPVANQRLVPGKLRLFSHPKKGTIIVWNRVPNKAQTARARGISEGDQAEWTVVADQQPDEPTLPEEDQETCERLWPELELLQLNSLRITDDGNQVTLIQKDGTNSNPLIFLGAGSDEFVNALRKYRSIRQSVSDDTLYILTDPKIDALDQKINALNILGESSVEGARGSVWKFVSDIRRDPYATTLTAFSKIADALIYAQSQDFRPEENVAELLQQSFLFGLDSTTNQLVTTPGDNDFEVIESRENRPNLLENLPQIEASWDPVDAGTFAGHFDSDGRLIRHKDLMMKVFRGGIQPTVRAKVWKYLLNYYPQDATVAERAKLTDNKKREYHRMKKQWQTLSPEQEQNFTAFRNRKDQIEKDVLRTDRNHPCFQDEDSTHLKILNDVLMTYVMYNFDLGYVQGMSDLLSPILYVMQNEEDSFWCFVGFMEKIKSNFDFDQGGIKKQFKQLAVLMYGLDPDFYAYLTTADSSNFRFAFRWLLIWFKREFNFDDILRLWEALWSGVMCPNFHLLLCVALLHNERAVILENKFGFSEILKHINELAFKIKPWALLSKAEAIQLKLTMTETEERAKNEEANTANGGETNRDGASNPDQKQYKNLMDIIHGRDAQFEANKTRKQSSGNSLDLNGAVQ